jgi:hypothetical protein
MILISELWDLYREWKHLTEMEGGAIDHSDWPEVHRCQAAKLQLQNNIICLTDIARNRCESASEQSEMQTGIRTRVNELIAMESRNSSVLEQRLSVLKQEKDQLNQTSRRVRQLHESYAPAQGPVWNTYS